MKIINGQHNFAFRLKIDINLYMKNNMIIYYCIKEKRSFFYCKKKAHHFHSFTLVFCINCSGCSGCLLYPMNKSVYALIYIMENTML